MQKNNNFKTFKIIIFGCGQIGYHHLCSITDLKSPKIQISVIEKNLNRIKELKKINFTQKNKNISIDYYSKASCLIGSFDLLIMCTTSQNRYKILKNILNFFEIKYLIIEKIAFQSVTEFILANNYLNKKKIKTWINCPRRTFESYKKIKKLIKNNQFVYVTGGNWSLSSNGIHFLDLFQYLFDSREIKLIEANLSKKILNSKRLAYKNFSGTMIFSNTRRNLLILNDELNKSDLKIFFFNKSSIYEINQNKEILIKHNIDKNFKKKIFVFKLPKQSDLTKHYVKDLIKYKNCKLTTIAESFFAHQILIKSFNKHLSIIFSKKIYKSPIT